MNGAGRLGRGLLVAGAVAMVAAVVAAIVVMGGPGAQRAARLDDRRIDDLVRLQSRIERHAKDEGALPADLAALSRRDGVRLRDVGPDGEPYRYEAVDARRYRLCATFATDDTGDAAATAPWRDAEWRHPAGEHCFVRTVPGRPPR